MKKICSHNFVLLWRYYSHAALTQIAIAFAISIVASLACIWLIDVSVKFVSLIMSLLTLYVAISPALILKNRNTLMEAMLPVTPMQLTLLLSLLCLVAMPIVIMLIPKIVSVFLTPEILQYALEDSAPFLSYEQLSEWNHQMCFVGNALSFFELIAPAATCMYCMVAWPGKVFKAMGFAVLTIVANGLLAGLLVFVYAIKSGFDAALEGVDTMPDVSEYIEKLINFVSEYIWVYYLVALLWCVYMIRCTYMKYKYRQI